MATVSRSTPAKRKPSAASIRRELLARRRRDRNTAAELAALRQDLDDAQPDAIRRAVLILDDSYGSEAA